MDSSPSHSYHYAPPSLYSPSAPAQEFPSQPIFPNPNSENSYSSSVSYPSNPRVYYPGDPVPYPSSQPSAPSPYVRSVAQLQRTDTSSLYNTNARLVAHPSACKKCNGTGTTRKGRPCRKCDESRRGVGRGLGRGTMVARRGLGVGGFGFLGMIRRLFRGM